ncbi:hypothetical protein [Clostridium taeniosporum]|uniref:Lipoprotein n=1 Tax=Clostridium taeniosporum TaxID=394958 RepID=A0A1D7XM27_9CLOT|nr:hypothetical protein [Clostridium taeniosporum]AOR24149.1 hypothetical protein BGI42_10600 [Clostridium taeniosporum]
MSKKTFIFIIISSVLILSLVACNTVDNTKVIKIKSAKLTQKEENLLKLVKGNSEYKIYDYVLNDKVKSVHINFLTLNSNNEWKENGGASSEISNPTGRIAISSVGENGNLQISIQNGGSIANFKSNSEVYKNLKEMGRAMVWGEESDVVYEKEIPLFIQIISNSSEIEASMDGFYNTDKLKDYDIVNAVTVTFSEDPIN